jgi:hypothetical protein
MISKTKIHLEMFSVLLKKIMMMEGQAGQMPLEEMAIRTVANTILTTPESKRQKY